MFFSKYYEKDALVADPGYGSILSSLLGMPNELKLSLFFSFKYKLNKINIFILYYLLCISLTCKCHGLRFI